MLRSRVRCTANYRSRGSLDRVTCQNIDQCAQARYKDTKAGVWCAGRRRGGDAMMWRRIDTDEFSKRAPTAQAARLKREIS